MMASSSALPPGDVVAVAQTREVDSAEAEAKFEWVFERSIPIPRSESVPGILDIFALLTHGPAVW